MLIQNFRIFWNLCDDHCMRYAVIVYPDLSHTLVIQCILKFVILFQKYRPIMINTKKIQKQKWGKTQYLRMAIILLLVEMQWTWMNHVMQYTLILTGKGWKGIMFEHYDYFVCLLYWVATVTLKALHNCAPFRLKYFKRPLNAYLLFHHDYHNTFNV